MTNSIIHIIELNVAITLLFVVYQLFFRKDRNFNSRRGFLLFSMIISFIVPFLTIELNRPAGNIQTAVITLEEIVVTGTGNVANSPLLSMGRLMIYLYSIVTMFFLLKLIFGVLKILIHAIRSPKITLNNRRIIFNSNFHASSFFQLIFLDPSSVKKDDQEIILQHEYHHVQLWHSADRIMAEIILAFSWFNPVAWMLRKAIVVNHEYQADNRVIERGTDQVSYQLSILNQYIGSASITNQFSSQIKNRINMINKNYKKGSAWKGLMLIPVSLALLLIMACNNETLNDPPVGDDVKAPEEEIFFVVEEMPQWKDGGDLSLEMRKFIAQNLKYPDKAIEAGAEGKVFIQFLVTKTGEVVIPDPDLLPPPPPGEAGADKEVVVVTYRPLDPEQDLPDDEIIELFKKESERVIELLPEMVPGKQRGKNVNVMFTMPIVFKMQ